MHFSTLNISYFSLLCSIFWKQIYPVLKFCLEYPETMDESNLIFTGFLFIVVFQEVKLWFSKISILPYLLSYPTCVDVQLCIMRLDEKKILKILIYWKIYFLLSNSNLSFVFDKKYPSNRIRTSDLRMSAHIPLQSSALPTELSRDSYLKSFAHVI